MISVKNSLYLLISLLLFLGIFLSSSWVVYAKEENKLEPVIQTTKTGNGTSIIVNFPEGYAGRVLTTYDGKEFKTTTIPLTKDEIKKMNEQMIERQKAIQKMFEEQQKMFDLMWKNFWF